MWALSATLLLLHIAQLCSAKCNLPVLENGILDLGTLNSSWVCVNASSKSVTKIKGKLPQGITTLDLSYNKLKELPQEFLDSISNLKMLYLNDNELRQFPSKFSSKSLKLLRLEGNELTSLQTNDFPKSLTYLSVDCSCELVITNLSYCAKNCTLITECRKFSDTGLSNAYEYYAQECAAPGSIRLKPSIIIIAIVVSILILLLVAGVAYGLIQRKKGVTFGQDKRASNTSDAIHGQPRYLTHSGPQDLSTEHHANYENVFIDKPPEAKSGSNDHRGQRQSKSRLSSRVEKVPAEQPIYANTQDVYYNCPGQTASEALDEEVYIMPDQ